MAPEAIPAATLIVFREINGVTEHLFVERARTMSFAAGALVFPGGRVDEGDRLLAERFPEFEPDEAAARIAAIRETIEEAGIAVGLSSPPDAATLVRMRHQLNEGMVFSDVLAAAQCGLALDDLTAFARWCPKMHQSRNFDTRFYLARIDPDAHAASVDATENVRLLWASAQAVLDQADAGEVQVIFPTRRNLERLASLEDFAAACAQSAAIPVTTITPWFEDRADGKHLCIAENAGYPITSELLTSVVRG
jgi:8-oxo-dGTP pyrophosphatase MutT (NUDIX family)